MSQWQVQPPTNPCPPNSRFSSFPPNNCCRTIFPTKKLSNVSSWNETNRKDKAGCVFCVVSCFFSLFFCFLRGVGIQYQPKPRKHPCKSSGNQPTVQAAGSALDRWASAPKVPGESSASFAVEKSRPSVSFAKEPLGEAEVVGWVGHLSGANHREDEMKWCSFYSN